MHYSDVRLLHQSAVLVSVSGFALRGEGSLLRAPWVQTRLARTIPHLIDTILLGSALVLLWWNGGAALHESWLRAKLLGLLAYIGLGAITLRKDLPGRGRACAFVAALLTAGWMASVAILKSPWGLLSGWIGEGL